MEYVNAVLFLSWFSYYISINLHFPVQGQDSFSIYTDKISKGIAFFPGQKNMFC